jgi:RimJ/RimL family protein N-acetyltransferase
MTGTKKGAGGDTRAFSLSPFAWGTRMIRLVPMTDADFAWLLGEGVGRGGMTMAEGGVATPAITAQVRRVTAETARETRRQASWMIANDQEVVGLISSTKPAGRRRVELGYGIAASREGRGHVTAAIAAMIRVSRSQGLLGLTAETGIDNRGSQRVLEKNGFVRTGMRHDAEDGALVTWSFEL